MSDADGTASTGGFIIRKCESLPEMEACVSLQKEVWQFADADLIPARMFVSAAKIGGQVIGAYINGASEREEAATSGLAGFALAFPGQRNRHTYLHSQMLAVRHEYRDLGLGRRLKLWQREDALARGIELMEWTFDPLEIKNSFFNIEKLGAIARRYEVNRYGIATSPLQGGLPTDRLVAEWWLKSERAEAALGTGKRNGFEVQRRIDVPAEIHQWKVDNGLRPRALALQEANRGQFLAAFAEGLSVLGYERDEHGNGTFLLGLWDNGSRY